MKKLSLFAERFVPQFVKDENPGFVLFLEGYLKYLESSGGPYDVVSKLVLDENMSVSIQGYISEFQSKYSPFLPKESVANIDNIFRQIRGFYKAKGTEDSFKWIFRTYYGSDLSFYYPANDILRCSDGKWYKPAYVHITDLSDNPIQNLSKYIGSGVVGTTSGDSGVVDGVIQAFDASDNTIKPALSIVKTSFQFIEGETLSVVGSADTIRITNHIGAIIIQDGNWKGTDGQISSNKRIQDNYYYQDLSYQLNVGVSSDTFRLMSKSAIHPAGRIMFASVEIISSLAKFGGAVRIFDTTGVEWIKKITTSARVSSHTGGLGFETKPLISAQTTVNLASLIRTKAFIDTPIARLSINSNTQNNGAVSTKWDSSTLFFGNDVGLQYTLNLNDAIIQSIVEGFGVAQASVKSQTLGTGTINNTFSSDTNTLSNVLNTFGGAINQPAAVQSVTHNVGSIKTNNSTWNNGTINNTFSSNTNLLNSKLETFGGGSFIPNFVAIVTNNIIGTNGVQTTVIPGVQSDRFNSTTISMNNPTWTFGDTGLQTVFSTLDNVRVSMPPVIFDRVSGTSINTYNSNTLLFNGSLSANNGNKYIPAGTFTNTTGSGSLTNISGSLTQNTISHKFKSDTLTFGGNSNTFNSNII